MRSATVESELPHDAHLPAAEVPDELPRSILRLFWLFARPHRAIVLLMMMASLSLRGLLVMQFYAMKRIIDTAVRLDLRSAAVWRELRSPLLGFFAVVGVSLVVEWGAWYGSYSSRIPVL